MNISYDPRAMSAKAHAHEAKELRQSTRVLCCEAHADQERSEWYVSLHYLALSVFLTVCILGLIVTA